MAREVRVNRMVLSTAIAHTHTEQTSSPTITPLTIQWACKNSVNNERSEEVSGRADCATSFMEHPFDQTRGDTRSRTSEQNAPDPHTSAEPSGFARNHPAAAGPDEFIAKHVQTWAVAAQAITRHLWLTSG